MTRRNSVLVAVLLALLPVFTLQAGSIFDLLQSSAPQGTNEALEVVIKLPLDSIYAKTSNEQFAVLSFTDHTGLAQRWPLHVDVRGKYRRRICTCPPLKLNFSKKLLKEQGLTSFDKLKLVTPCAQDEEGQNLILKEYLAYRMLNQLTPASFRVQLLKVTYQDQHGNHPDYTAYAFVLEDTDELALRLGGEKMKNGRGLTPARIDRQAETTQALFSYFIGNTDWNLATSHNLKMIETEGGKIIPVPYDFDFAAIVAAPYAKPSNSIGQYTLKQRVYMGFTASDEQLDAAVASFKEQKKELFKIVRQFSLLPLNERYAVTGYLSQFFSDVKQLRKPREEFNSFYARLRGDQTELVPPGADPEYYGVGQSRK
jgi:hypothetical protein